MLLLSSIVFLIGCKQIENQKAKEKMKNVATQNKIQERLHRKARQSMKKLCTAIADRSVGSEGNVMATRFFEKELNAKGWQTETAGFDVIDWKNEGTGLFVKDTSFKVFASPYSLGCNLTGTLTSASTTEDLGKLNGKNKIILLHGALTKEPLMPKNFVFYNPEEHQRIIGLLEKSNIEAIICATENIFPIFEDGDFNIPSVYMSSLEGEELLKYVGQEVTLVSKSRRIPSKAYNVISRNKGEGNYRIVITAHIDSKKGTPGALDNATGITTLILLADLLQDYRDKPIEIVALNGEDYYSVPGQINYMNQNQGKFENIEFNINIDGIGYKEGKTAFSFFGLPDEINKTAYQVMNQFPEIEEGIQWPQGDHSMFVQAGRPAIAITSKWFLDNLYTQNITHTPMDNLDMVNYKKIVETAVAINSLIRKL